MARRKITSPHKTIFRVSKYTIVGITLTVFNFIVYTIFARTIFSNNNDLLWLDSMISYLLATILAYILHSRITWSERHPGPIAIIKFLFWNIVTALAISPFFTWLFGFFTPIYQLAFSLSGIMHLPFDYNFIESTGIFVFTTIVTLILNYLFYDKIVFDQPSKKSPKSSKSSSRSPINPANLLIPNAKVSIIVPIYNTARYLEACLDSIAKQTYRNLEVILINDGSTDNSGHLADQFAKKDPRFQVIHQKNRGQSAARNIGLKQATGDFVSFIDSDDTLMPTYAIDLLSAYGKKTSLAVCGMHYRKLRQKITEDVYLNPLRAKKPHESTKGYILFLLAVDGRLYSCNNKLYRAKIAKKCHFDEKLNFSEDTKFVLDYLAHTTGDISFVLKPLYVYNFGTDTSTIINTSTNWQNWQNAYHNLQSWLGPNPSLSEQFWLHLVHLRWRISLIRSRRRAKA